MNHNSYPSSREDGNQPNDSYTKWQETMKNIGLQEDKASASTINQETFATQSSPEIQEKPVGIKKILGKIQGVKDFVKNKFGSQSSEKLVEMTDDALVFVAKETITTADEDGIRTEAEAAEIEEAVSSVIVQGAMEEAGIEQSTGENPILELNQDDTQPDLMASIETLHEEGAMLPSGESVAGLAARAIERDKKWDLTKVSGPLGSNEGGWYEKPNGEQFYVKFYENPSQGQAEFVANAIYAKLGIKAVRSEIIQLDGREAIASPAVPGAMPANAEAQSSSEDVQKGFVADAFLANWDVVGLVCDNIVQGEDGFYRIDNGGSLIFRAQGGDKAYSPDSIPELQTMRIRKPGRPTGEVFAGITEDEIGRQARELVSKLNPEDIRAIVDESGLEGKDRDRILNGLLGRREYLARTYRPRSVSEAIIMLRNQNIERTSETALRPRSEVICDHDHLEGQRVDVINKKDFGTMEIKLKMRSPTESMANLIKEFKDKEEEGQIDIITPSGAILKRGEITYRESFSKDSEKSNKRKLLCDALVLEKDGIKVFVANPTSRKGQKFIGDSYNNPSSLVHSAIGLVIAEVPSGMDPEATEQILGEILEKDLGIPDALGEVPEEAEREYKIARYKWQHKISGDLTPEQMEQAERLEREEVFPGYTTLVEKGKHKEYLEEYGEDVRMFHALTGGDANSIFRVLTQGLMGTTERYSRGVFTKGKSSFQDMNTGGADSVYTRIANKAARQGFGILYPEKSLVVLKPEVFDRTDWYSYERDRFGSTDDAVFTERLSPDSILNEKAKNNYTDTNEQMFRTGIGAEYIEAIEVNPKSRDAIITDLRSMGLEEVGGRPIEEIIVSHDTSAFGTDQDAIQKLGQNHAEKQAKIQALINGQEPYTTVDEILDLAVTGDDFYFAPFKSMAESAIAQVGKEQLLSDMSEYLKENLELHDLEALASGEIPDDSSADIEKLFSYLQNTLGIDYSALYEEVLASQSETTPSPKPNLTPKPVFNPFSEVWGVLLPTSTPPPEPPPGSADT